MKSSFEIDLGLVKKMSPFDKVVFFILSLLLFSSSVYYAYTFNQLLLIEVPAEYGEINEGVVGVPISFNPLTAINTVEKDISYLLYSGLLKRNTNNEYVKDLASDFVKSGNNYAFKLRDDIYFHDGVRITAIDFVGMIKRVKDDGIESSTKDIWANVDVSVEYGDINDVVNGAEDIKVTNDEIILVKAGEGNSNFPEAFTLGVIPNHIWKKVPISETRVYRGPGVYVGSGPFMHDHQELTLDNKPTRLTLLSYPNYHNRTPFLEKINFHFFDSTELLIKAYQRDQIDSLHSISPYDIAPLLGTSKLDDVYTANTYRVFGVFFNVRDGEILADSFLRGLLVQGIDRDRIINTIFNGYANQLFGPFAEDTEQKYEELTFEEIKQTLDDVGWGFDSTVGARTKSGVKLELSILVPDVNELKQVMQVIEEDWNKIGVNLTMEFVDSDEILDKFAEGNHNAFIFGYDVNQISELAKVWDSRIDDNFSDITGWGSKNVNDLFDELLEDDKKEKDVYNDIQDEIAKNAPAIFLFSPTFIYILPNDVKGLNLISISEPKDRFFGVNEWHKRKIKLWKIFANLE